MHIESLKFQYTINLNIIKLNCEGIDEQQALYRLNGSASVNWLVGHMLRSRSDALQLAGAARIDDVNSDLYYRPRHESAESEGDPATLSELLQRFQTSHEEFLKRMTVCIENADADKRMQIVKDFAFRSFHESYHVGQIAILRRAVGLQGKIA